MNFALSFNKAYLEYAIVTITSICESNAGHHDIYILHSELNDQDVASLSNSLKKYDVSINPIKVDFDEYKNMLPTSCFWSYEIYYRMLLPELLPASVDRILYLDVDVIVHGPLDDFYYMNFEGADLGACYDSNGMLNVANMSEIQQQMFAPLIEQGYQYFNSGVLLMNIEAMRGQYSFETYLSAMRDWDFKMSAPDQDILNYVHHSKVKYADYQKYDLFAKLAYNSGWSYGDVLEKNVIVHFAGSKPWISTNIHYSIEKIWWDYAKKTPYYFELLEKFAQSVFDDTSVEDYLKGLIEESTAQKKLMQQIMDKMQAIYK